VREYDLNGKVALITGGARGIGFGLAEALLSRGARVALVDLDLRAAQSAAGELSGDGRTIGLAADVTDRPAIEQAVRDTVEAFGGLDVVVANAGIAPTPLPVRVMPQAEFERVVEVDLLGVYRTVSAAMEQVVSRRGQVVVVSSVYAFANGMSAAPYAVAKAGVEQLGRALRVELSIHGVGVTVAYFGFVDTEMVRQVFEQGEAIGGREPGEALPAFLLRRITPRQAGEALAAGIERRRPRVIAPRWWAVGSVLRGFISPALDYLATRAPRVQEMLREADSRAFQAPQDRVSEEVMKEPGSGEEVSLPSAAEYEKSV
jgi:NAD(P)-dependent dehydrogenase (short-subunit alcohol dehydrogenase family)